MRKLSCGFGLLLAAASTLAMVGPRGESVAVAAGDSARAVHTPIKHVVIIYQENHSFDSVLGAVCQRRSNPCNGNTGPVTFADGTTAPNIVEPDIVPEVQHDPDSQALALSNQWDRIAGCRQAPYDCVSHVSPSTIPNLTALADTFAVSDATYAVGRSASFGAHVTLVAGTMDGFVGFNPKQSLTGIPPGVGWGCPSRRDALWGRPKHESYQPSCVPSRSGKGPYRPSKVPYVPTVMQLLENAGDTWHIYEGPFAEDGFNRVWSVCDYFYWCYHNRLDPAHHSPDAAFIAAAKQGSLANLSILLPTQETSQHNDASMQIGDNYIGTMLAAVENGPDWNSTAVFITYDDCGCFYDHVTPPDGLGLRNPMVIVSPWVKPSYTDSVTAVQPYSMLAFVQHNFGLGSLSRGVDEAYDYSRSFDFSQQPLRPVTMTTGQIPQAERVELRHLLPKFADDDT
jgi:phospholipase C